MYLKRLDLQGFKSFPEKVKLEFNQGVTAVVGPNGSGKSNVSDAVRWVLGEQRAKSLRGDKMEDVIFAGTENRKPLGFAEVSITIDNQDQKLPLAYTEVQVTRRVFRSGESEYRINGTACRLKDIQELFMDTGVGREGYSIVGQGRIDEILSAKGDERRRIFEEAAGIVKYKTRRNEAASKLEREQQNLLRVDDIIGELEVQLEPLEEQSEKAKRYLIFKEELKEAEIVAFCRDLSKMEESLAKILQDKALAEEQLKEHLAQEGKDKAEICQLKNSLEQLDVLIQQQNQEIAELRAEKERKEGEIRLTEEQKQNDASNLARIQREILQKQEQKAENQNQLELCTSRITALGIEMELQQGQLSKLEQEYASLNSSLHQDETQAESYKDEIFEQIKAGTEAKGEIAKREALREQFLNRMVQLQTEKTQLESRIHQLEIHIQALDKQEADMKENASFMEKELLALEKDKLKAQKEKEDAQGYLSTEGKVLSEIQSRLSVLKEMERENEGFFHSVKSLLNLPDKEKRGICGAVGQLFKVDELYEVAIEGALGGAMQNVVTKTEEDAREAINYLKNHNLGRATFLPISAIKGHTFEGRPPILDEVGVIGVAHELISFDDMYRQIAENLLGRTIIMENLEQAVILAKKYKHQYKMVTLEGDILNPGGAMTGGSKQKKAAHIFSRGREIRSLQEKMESTGKLVGQLQEKLSLFQEDMAEIEEQILEKRMELQRMTVTLNSSHGDREKTSMDTKENQERLKLILLEEGQLQEQLLRTEKDIQIGKETLAFTESKVEQVSAALMQFQDNLTDEKGKRDTVMTEITSLKIGLSKNGQNISNIEETVLRLQREIQTLLQQIKLDEEKISVLGENTEKKDEAKAVLQEESVALDKKIRDLQEALTKTTEEKNKISQVAETVEQRGIDLREASRQMESELFRLEAKGERLEEEKMRITTQMWEEYEMTYRMALEYTSNKQNDLKSRPVKEIRGDIRSLGDVNVGAIEQYKEVKERYAFLTQQRADILEAEEKLRGIIEELSLLMEKQFREQFQLISESFSRVFQEMFGGGKAYLRLLDTERVLESPIEIIAQPPGKNLQNMQLLSGGERALTAIAILFSILYLKPSPFCILDEIEAALDDANVSRFAQYLKKFANDTQFIVITHRKGTMEYADVMYGVTMQEKGISKLISVDFSEQKKDAM
ncbi:chromosome segregation protein SMC [Anaerotignum propionicum]|uniref:Chromosome partition protein Smc n=2 Tax=root TaxID=1 RepID=A0A110A766_ANAPI|nr:chromosome segregation protein SMC [Anaerotignum propionicum]AMJ41780.1 chromosome partition protein Smc [Anaerotignum propionicum DSM 1682]SHE84420.1 condensin subunit Smc [[Clostridium] propionicum DSM 1682] [Anaerotignum propionicum DSM 1682]